MLCEKCREELAGLQNLFDQYSTGTELEIPVRITERGAAVHGDFEVYVS